MILFNSLERGVVKLHQNSTSKEYIQLEEKAKNEKVSIIII